MTKRDSRDSEIEKLRREGFKHGEPGRERNPERERNSGDDPRRHMAILDLRWMGSPPPTAERYANALKQWRALPGAVVQSAAEVFARKASPLTEEQQALGLDRTEDKP